MKLRLLPEPSLWDSINCNHNVQRNAFKSLFCRHLRIAPYGRTDHRSGPGIYSDSYSGHACIDCGYIVDEVKTW